jgi:hypothetical protein
VTDDGGQAAVSVPLDLDPGRYPVAVAYAGGSGYAPSSATSWLDVVPDVTTLVYTGQTQGQGEMVQVSALLTEDGDVPLPGRPVSFTLQGTTVTATTDTAGRAQTVMDAPDHGRSQTVSVHFPGQTRYIAASTTGTVAWGGPSA